MAARSGGCWALPGVSLGAGAGLPSDLGPVLSVTCTVPISFLSILKYVQLGFLSA